MATRLLLRAAGRGRLARPLVRPRMFSTAPPPGCNQFDDMNLSLRRYLGKGQIRAAAQYITEAMVGRGVVPRSDLMQDLVVRLCSSNRVEEASRVLSLAPAEKADGCTLVSYSHVMEQLLRRGMVDRALRLFDQAEQRNLLLDLPCCNRLLAAVGPTGKPEHIQRLLGYVKARGLGATAETYGCAVWSALQMKDYAKAANLCSAADDEGLMLPIEAWLAVYAVSFRALHSAERVSEERVLEQLLHMSSVRLKKLVEKLVEEAVESEELEEGARAHGVLDGLDRGGEEDEEDDFGDDEVDEEGLGLSGGGSKRPSDMYLLSGAYDDEDDEDEDYDWDDDEEEDDDEDDDEEEEEDEHAPPEAALRSTLMQMPREAPPREIVRQVMPWGPLSRQERVVAIASPSEYIDQLEDESDDDEEGFGLVEEEVEVVEEEDQRRGGRARLAAVEGAGEAAEVPGRSSQEEEEYLPARLLPVRQGAAGVQLASASATKEGAEGQQQQGAKPAAAPPCSLAIPDLTSQYVRRLSKQHGEMLFRAELFSPKPSHHGIETLDDAVRSVFSILQQSRAPWRR